MLFSTSYFLNFLSQKCYLVRNKLVIVGTEAKLAVSTSAAHEQAAASAQKGGVMGTRTDFSDLDWAEFVLQRN